MFYKHLFKVYTLYRLFSYFQLGFLLVVPTLPQEERLYTGPCFRQVYTTGIMIRKILIYCTCSK